MDSNQRRLFRLKRVVLILPVIIAAFIIAEVVYLKYFNNVERKLIGNDETGGASLVIDSRDSSTSTWLKREYHLYDESVDLTAQTTDGVFLNNTSYSIRNWSLRINIHSFCLLNQAWCGTMEVHQFVDGVEKVQTLDLRNFELSDVTLDYLYDGDLLIPLNEGDYVIYYPSETDGETEILKNSQITMGMIFYYLDPPDLSDHEVTYNYHRTFISGYNIYLLIILVIVWAGFLLTFLVTDSTYKHALKEMEIKKSGIMSMSDLYSIIYIIDLKKNTLMPVVADSESEKLRPQNMSASEQLQGMFEYDCAEAYKEMAREFSDFSTLSERLKNKNNIAFEYVSKVYGWCRVRFFVMDRKEGEELQKVIFAIQVINDEKKEAEEIAKRIDEAEHESMAKSNFLANMSKEIHAPIDTVIDLNSKILNKTLEPETKTYAKSLNNAAKTLASMIDGIIDISKIEADKLELEKEIYSFKKLMVDTVGEVRAYEEFEKLNLDFNISETIPSKLYGDRGRLKQVIVSLIRNAGKYTEKGGIKLSVFGKEHDGKEHLLVSVKDTGIGMNDTELKKLSALLSNSEDKKDYSTESLGIDLRLASGLLKLMGSELKVLSEQGSGSEFYFEIDEEIALAEPTGKIVFDAEISDR